jgi:hypothetical protein
MSAHVRKLLKTALCCSAIVSCLPRSATALTATWTSSDADWWFYTNSLTSGTRALGPSFLGDVSINSDTGQFNPETVTDPVRRGMDLIAFNTASQITAGLPANRYQINSVTVETTFTYAGATAPIYYQNTPVTQQEMLSEASSGGITAQKPMELYGVGFRAGYTGFGFGSSSGSNLLTESVSGYSAPDGGYVAYPVDGTTTPGTYIDVSNSVTGGFSTTAPSQNTAPFTATPWAIGKANLSPGDAIPDKTTFTFKLDLTAPGVLSYLQQSLASGALGVFVSSLHSTGEFGAGGGYPQWYNKEASGFPYFVPTAANVPADYDVDDVVDAADYVLWRKGASLQNQVDDPSTVNQQDYAEWRALFGNTSFLPHLLIDYSILPAGAGSLASGGSIPEPSTLLLSLAAICAALSMRSRRSNKW